MGSLIDYSNYVLSLATHTLTDQIRNRFKSTFDSSNIVDASNVFNQVSITLLKSLDANTGYYIYDRLNEHDKEYLTNIAEHVLKIYKSKRRKRNGRYKNDSRR